MNIQEKIIRTITYKPCTSDVDPRIMNIHILPLKKLAIPSVGLQMFKFSQNHPVIVELFSCDQNIHNYFHNRDNNIITLFL